MNQNKDDTTEQNPFMSEYSFDLYAKPFKPAGLVVDYDEMPSIDDGLS